MKFPYLARDIAKMLGQRDAGMLLRFVDDKDKTKKSTMTNGGAQMLSYLSLNGVVQIITKSRKLSSAEKEELLKQFTEENVVYIGAPKEIEFISKLERQLIVFGITDFSRQHIINGKRIDLYLSQVNIAIEYDENDHAGYSYDDQESRQQMIENELNCTFIRVSDKQDDETNCAIILKELLNLRKVN